MPDEGKRAEVIVVGGGIAGLATGYLIRELGREAGRDPRVTVLEAGERHGGSTRTTHDEGYVCEWGPNGFLDNEPATLKLVDRLGLRGELVRADEASANRYIYHGGAMRQVPTKPPRFLASDILPLSAKLRMAMEFFIPAKRDDSDESVDRFGRRRLGARFAELMLDPMVSGIFAGDTRQLSLPAVFPKMVAMEREYGGLFKALIAKQKQARKQGTEAGGPAGPKAALHTFEQGMGRLPDRLAEELSDALKLNTPVTAVEHRSGGGFVVRGEGWSREADVVVLAAPSHATAGMIRDLSPEVADAIGDIWHAPVDVVCHGHPEEHLSDPLHGFGVLVPRSEGVRMLGSLWSDAIFPGQAPRGHRLLRTILGGAHDPKITELSADQLHATAHLEHRQVMGIQDAPTFRTEFRHPRGIAQYTIGHLDRVAASEGLERNLPGLYFTGASYRGVSINGCAKDAFRVAKTVWHGSVDEDDEKEAA